MATIVVLNIYLVLILLVLFLLRAPLRRIGAAYILCFAASLALLGFFYMLIKDDIFRVSHALFTLPWPTPHAAPSVPELAYDYGTDWYRIFNHIGFVGIGASALIMLLRHILFRRRMLASQSPAPQHILDAAQNVFAGIKTARLMDECKKTFTKPSAEELEKASNPNLPRIYLSSAVDGPVMLSFPDTLILPDNASYSDEQLAFLLRLVYHICEDRSISSDKIRYLINQCAGWFNPLLPLFRRAGGVTECTGIDRVITKEFTPEEKAEYLETLESLASEQPSSLHYFRLVGGEAEIALRREQVNTTVQKDIVMTIACFALVIALLFGASFLIQSPGAYPVNEESVFSVLGEDPEKLYGDRRSIDLCSTEEDGLLYGTPYFNAYSAKNDQRICFHYPPDAAPELLESSAQRILDALTERLGPPDGKRDTDASLEVSGALINEIDQQMNLLLEAAGYTPPEEDPSQVNLLIRHQWSVKNTNGESCIVILRIQPGGAYWNEETRGGLLIEIELQ